MWNVWGGITHEEWRAVYGSNVMGQNPDYLVRHARARGPRLRSRSTPALLAWIAIVLVSGCCVLGTVLGLAGTYWWALDLLAGFQVQYAIVLLPATILYAWRERWLAASLTTAALLINATHIAPLYLGKPAHAATHAPRIELLLLHVDGQDSPERRNAVLAQLRSAARSGPLDAMVILGVTEPWLLPLDQGLPGYQLTAVARNDRFGMAVLAREPVVQSTAIQIAKAAVPAIELVIERGGERFAVLATHVPAPTSRDLARRHAELIAAIGRWVASREDHAVVVGNLNATLWSHSLRTLLDACHIMSSQVGFGLQATWPAVRASLAEDSVGISDPGMPSPGIPIDQVLHGNSLTTLAHEVGPSLGMAHRSVRVTLAPRALP